MQQTARRILYVLGLAGMAAACASTPPNGVGSGGRSSGGYKVGKPYQIGDTWYYPREQPDYDKTGIASWYGPAFYGKQTANGELFDGNGLTAAHPTLPMPVNVRVTNLDNGKSTVVRVNDRGPYAQGRIIDVSRHAAEVLGFYAKGTAHVRVTYLGRANLPNGSPAITAPEIARAIPSVRAGKVVVASIPKNKPTAPPAPVQMISLPPPPMASVVPPPAAESSNASDENLTGNGPSATHLFVQAGAFGSRENADRLKEQLAGMDGLFISEGDRDGKPLYRVRCGPYDDLEAANAALARLSGLGNNDARIVVDQ
jgi:rare lipoprotein A